MPKSKPPVKTDTAVATNETVSAPTSPDDVNRPSIIEMLKDMGITVDESKSTSELTKDLHAHVTSLHQRVVEKEVNKAAAAVKRIKGQSNLTDEAFILRLLALGIQEKYLLPYKKSGAVQYVFSDTDKSLSDKQLHLKVRRSGINPLKGIQWAGRTFKRPPRYERKTNDE